MKVLSFGEILLRLASPGYTKLFQKDSLDATFCGGEANVAVSLANFGIQSEFLTVVPDNDVGRASLNALKYFGVDTSKTFFKNGRMGLYYLEKGASQRSSKVIYDRAFSSIALAEPTDFDWDALFDGVNWFHWTGINPALSDNMVQICEQACKKAKEKGITISCDLNFRKNLWSSEKAQDVMRNLVYNCCGRVGCSCYKQLPVKQIGETKSKFFLRIHAQDKPGVLANIASVLGNNGVSIAQVVQKSRKGGIAELVIITDEVQENNFNDAMTIFSGMSVVKEISGVIRVY